MRNRISHLLLSSFHLEWCDAAGSVHYRSKIPLISRLAVFCCTEKQWLPASIPAAVCSNSGKAAPGVRLLKPFWMRLFCPRTGGMALVFIGKGLLRQFVPHHLTLICAKLHIQIQRLKAKDKMYIRDEVMVYVGCSIKILHTAVT